MAACSGTQLTVDWFGLETTVFNMSDWTNVKDSESDHLKRSEIVHAIVHNHSLDHLGTILGSGWDVNETLRIPAYRKHEGMENSFSNENHLMYHYIQRTALGEAARQGWTEGVRMLLDAGAKCKTPGVSLNILMLALHNPDPDLIKLLLEHGADPNHHDELAQNIPLLHAISDGSFGNTKCKQNVTSIAKLLLEHGADPNVSGDKGNGKKSMPLYAALHGTGKECTALFRTLVLFGADVNYTLSRRSLLHVMICIYSCRDSHMLLEHLDLFFTHGGNITMKVDNSALEYAIGKSNSNSIRWLIRHGADTSHMRFTLLRDHFIGGDKGIYKGTPLILLQAGMRLSHGAATILSNIRKAILTWLQDDTRGEEDIRDTVSGLWPVLYEDGGPQLKKSFSDYLTHQMADLQEFSDKSLQLYPEVNYTKEITDRQYWQKLVDQIHKMLDFSRQPQSLEWYCRRCVQENLVSLQPAVVKTLPIPARLKRYVLCHEI